MHYCRSHQGKKRLLFVHYCCTGGVTKVILIKAVQGLGNEGETKVVKDGYARNWLIPQGLVCAYNETNLKIYAERKRIAERKKAKERLKAEALKSRIESLSITVPMEVGENNKLFGSVTSGLVSEALKEEEYKIDHRSIIIDEPIKELGVYTVKICLHPDVYANLKVWVVPK